MGFALDSVRINFLEKTDMAGTTQTQALSDGATIKASEMGGENPPSAQEVRRAQKQREILKNRSNIFRLSGQLGAQAARSNTPICLRPRLRDVAHRFPWSHSGCSRSPSHLPRLPPCGWQRCRWPALKPGRRVRPCRWSWRPAALRYS